MIIDNGCSRSIYNADINWLQEEEFECSLRLRGRYLDFQRDERKASSINEFDAGAEICL